METKETILAKLNTSPDRLTELVEQDGFYFVRKEITREQYPVIKQFYEYQQQSPSPAIVTIYSVYEKEGHFYINEEWIRGESVEEHLYLQGPFSKDEVIRYAMDLCQGLQWFHKHNMIHRDVTPANVIISEEKKAYLVDPGILREVKKNQTNDTQILGTPGYAAPEQFGFTQSDARTDIYALGVLINQMTTGKMPKEALPKDRRLRKIVTKCTQISAEKRNINCHHIYKQFYAHRRPGKKHLRLHVLAAFAAEIVEYRPDLQTFFMRPIHIGLICQRFIRAAVAAKRKPRRRDDIDTFRLCNQRIQLTSYHESEI